MDCTVDWTDLPSEILFLIAGKLTNVWDYIRFRAVCVSWRLVAGTTDLQIPWLVTSTLKEGCLFNEEGTTKISFFDQHAQPSCNYFIEIHETHGKWIFGSAHGWLLMGGNLWSETSFITLLNPITKEEIELPHLPIRAQTHWKIKKAVLCSHPAYSCPGKLLVVIWDTDNRLAFFRQGEDGWTIIRLDCWTTKDIAYFNDELYLIDYMASLSVLQVESSTIRQLIHPRPPEVERLFTLHLVEVAGDLLLVTRYMHKLKLAVFKLDRSNNRESNWVKIGDITPKKAKSDDLDFFYGWKGSVWAKTLPDGLGYQVYYADADEKDSIMTVTIRELHAIPGVGINMMEQPYYQTKERVGPQRLQGEGEIHVTWMVAKLR